MTTLKQNKIELINLIYRTISFQIIEEVILKISLISFVKQ